MLNFDDTILSDNSTTTYQRSGYSSKSWKELRREKQRKMILQLHVVQISKELERELL